MVILGIETSCDETSAAVVDDGYQIRSNVVCSQLDHARFGGVVPELASRAHVKAIVPTVNEALEAARVSPTALDGIAVTRGPGRAGSRGSRRGRAWAQVCDDWSGERGLGAVRKKWRRRGGVFGRTTLEFGAPRPGGGARWKS